jgi:hypothetical protein
MDTGLIKLLRFSKCEARRFGLRSILVGVLVRMRLTVDEEEAVEVKVELAGVALVDVSFAVCSAVVVVSSARSLDEELCSSC